MPRQSVPQQHTRARPRRARRQVMARAFESLERRIQFSTGFSDPVDHELTGVPEFITSADFNEDGHMDLVASAYNDGSVNILLGMGDGTFDSATPIDLAGGPDHVATGDVDADGHMDLVTVSYDDQNVSVLLGNGDGTFQSPASYSASPFARATVLGDFNGDNRLDIAIAKSAQTTLTILLNNGNGTFAPATHSTIGFTPTDLAAADFNGDGKLDLAAANFFGNSVHVMLGNGNGTFQAATSYATGAGPASIAVGDLNGDGSPEIATANYVAGGVSVLRSNGNGTFQAATNISTGAGATFVTFADVDADGKRDLVAVNTASFSVLRGNGDGTLAQGVQYPISNEPRSVAIADFDQSGLSDVALAHSMNNTVGILLGYDTGAAAPVASAGGPYSASEGGSVSLSASASTGTALVYTWDLDNDGIYGETGAGATRGNEAGVSPLFSAAGLDGPGVYTFQLRVTDALDRTSTATATINITNTAPTLGLTGPASTAAMSTYTLSLVETDAGADTITGWLIDWGDGNVQSVSGNPSSVTHVFATPGTVTVSATATDDDGTYSSPTKTISVSAPDTTAPTAALQSAPDLQSDASNTYNFVIAYGDDDALNLASLDVNDILVTGPGGFSSVAQFIGVTGAGSTRLATYRFTAPGGTWNAADNGEYTLSLRSEQVADASGNFAVGGALGTFNVAVLPPDLAGYSLETARFLGIFGPGVVKAAIDGVGALDRNDFYRIVLSGRANIYVKMYQMTANADLWLLDGSGNRIAYSKAAGAGAEAINMTLNAGTYYIRALYLENLGTEYRLRVETTAAPVDPLTTAANMGPIAPGMVRIADGSVGPTQTDRYYRFDVTQATLGYIKLYGLTDNADIHLLNSQGTAVASSTRSGTSQEPIWQSLSAGRYYVRVRFNGSAATAFRLRVEGTAVSVGSSAPAPTPFSSATNLGAISAGTVRAITDTVSTSVQAKYYSFQVIQPLSTYSKLYGLTDNVDLQLMNASGSVLGSSARSGTSDEPILINLAAGTYYLRVNLAGNTATSFRLRLAGS